MKKINLIVTMLAMGCGLMLSQCKKDVKNVDANEPVESAPTLKTLSVLFNGDASRGSANVWKDVNIEGTGTLTTVNDETGTLCWKFLKPVDSHRTEGHGAKNYQALNGDEIYIGWTSKLYMPTSLKTEAVFQWKSYPTDTMANHPLMLHTVNGNLELQNFDINHVATVPWSIPLSVSTWQSFVLRIKLSTSATTGYIELWYNGTKQTFTNGSQRYYCRTFDSLSCDPKWGVYGGDASQVTNIVKKIRIGTSYADVAQ
ncbi:heparin lyase I family protein [Mucilaginibacter boryungensis]|uniref:Heparin lyase I family protein n=1 Tax=Mucilaginibacter boryungensis TaxID=768480 RepID=A0ABR9XHT3_9SPHI|nr:heparin lyase I family protein [Mucilaginibacter boryungensis]MBE9666948.1 heparin lyase I family protein [Mucilaginibacter boryungensis]